MIIFFKTNKRKVFFRFLQTFSQQDLKFQFCVSCSYSSGAFWTDPRLEQQLWLILSKSVLYCSDSVLIFVPICWVASKSQRRHLVCRRNKDEKQNLIFLPLSPENAECNNALLNFFNNYRAALLAKQNICFVKSSCQSKRTMQTVKLSTKQISTK